MGAGEGVVFHALVDDPPYRRKRRGVELVEVGAGSLAGQADVGNRDRIPLAVAAGLLAAGKVGLQRGQRRADPVLDELEPRRLVDLELVLEIFAHPRPQQRMRVAGDDLRETTHACPRARLLRQERRLRMGLVEILDDGERLEQHRPVTVDQRRQHHLRIDLAVALLALLALHEVDVNHLVRDDALEVERDAHAIGGERAPEREQLHGTSPGKLLRGCTYHSISGERKNPLLIGMVREARMTSIEDTRAKHAKTHQHRSEVRDGMRIDWDVPITMDDGLVLRADVFRPVQEGRYPVILSYGPYAKGLAFQAVYPTAYQPITENHPSSWQRMAEKHPDVTAGSSNLYQSWEVVDPEK